MFHSPPGMTSAAPAALSEELSFLSPMQLLSKSTPDTGVAAPELPLSSIKQAQTTASTKKAEASNKKKKDTKKSPPPQPVAILQREEPNNRSASHPSGSNVDIRSIESTIEHIISSQFKSLESKVLDTVRKTVSSEVDVAISKAQRGDGKANQKLEKVARDGAEKAAKDAVAGMQGPIMAAVHEVLILCLLVY
jgi:hypothetical protein